MHNPVEIKTVFIGGEGVGKSTVLKALAPTSPKQAPLRLVDPHYVKKIIDSENRKAYQLNLSKVEGSFLYRSLAPVYYREANLIVLFFKFNNPQSFEVAKTFAEQIKQKRNAPFAHIHLLATSIKPVSQSIEAQCMSYQQQISQILQKPVSLSVINLAAPDNAQQLQKDLLTPIRRAADIKPSTTIRHLKRYGKFWHEMNGWVNVKQLLDNYCGNDRYCLTFTLLHPRRHHVQQVKKLLKDAQQQLYRGAREDAVIENLYQQLHAIKKVNPQGSLSRRLEFIYDNLHHYLKLNVTARPPVTQSASDEGSPDNTTKDNGEVEPAVIPKLAK